MAKSHSSGNGHQTRILLREARALRAERDRLQARTDRVLALADRELGIGEPGSVQPISGRRSTGVPPVYRHGQDGHATAPGAPFAGPGPVAPVAPVPEAAPISPEELVGKLQRGYSAVLGAPGTPIVSGFISDLGEYNPDIFGLNAVRTYEKMRRGDAQVRGLLRSVELPIRSAKWDVVADESQKSEIRSQKTANTGVGKTTGSKAETVRDFVRENLFGGLEYRHANGALVSQSFDDVLANCLRAETFGCAVAEIVYTVDRARLRVARLADRQALTFYRWHTDPAVVDPSLPSGVYDDGETLAALQQYGYRGSKFITPVLPADKILRITANQEGANFWGLPPTRSMYPHWFVKSALIRVDAIACERNGVGVPCIILPPGASQQDRDEAYNFVTQLAAHEKAGLRLPNGAEFQIIAPVGRPREILPSIEYQDMQMARALLAMFMQLGGGQTRGGASGSRALGKVQTDFFILAIQIIADRIGMAIRNQVIRPLVAMNFGEDAPVPLLRAANVQARTLEDSVEAIAKLGAVGAWISDRDSVNQVRTELGFHEFVDEDVVLGRGVTMPGGAGENQKSEGRNQKVEDRTQKSEIRNQKAKGKNPPALNSDFCLLTSDFPRSGRVRDQLSPFWHEQADPRYQKVHQNELHIDFPEHDRQLGSAESAVALALRAAHKKILRAVSEKMARALLAGKAPSAVTFEHDPELRAAVEKPTARAYEFGKRAVEEERDRLRKKIQDSKFQSPGMAVLAADGIENRKSKIENPPKLYAEIAVEDYGNQIAAQARNVANDLRKSGGVAGRNAGELADELFGAIADYSDGYIDRIAAEAARGAVGAGRADALERFRAELEAAKGFYERTAILDKNTCGPCEAADGDQIPAEDGLPPDPWIICEGAQACRCQWYEVISMEPVNP